ncbi:uncharacterized protein LOC126843518 isoform X1 [Adelges cooleyi]|uniref:uncharacterized protein LOC126843518 isoform X1 n=1 Tax=Adelges cooleyi TaxID=133065 RepID=UPI00218063EE|nr:uncharacterized protein LOC126843518 isoform X1 [Adelges cooleyi]XP_050437047.1 uncharacterized protein LOC126843518 isoform X1 [Adelges cooleyi]
MISHFSVILLCLSGAYSILSKIENLDLEGLKRVFNDETPINEWNTAMGESVYSKGPDGKEITVNVREAVINFKKNANENSEAEFLKIRDLIKLAYECTLTKYASFTTFLIVQDLLEFKTNTWGAIRHTELYGADFNRETIFGNAHFKNMHTFLSIGKYYLDFDFKINGSYQVFHEHTFHGTAKENIYLFWDEIIQKIIGLKIKYKVYSEVMRTKFKNEYYQPTIYTINELICVLNETVRLLDNFIVGKCVRHGGNFVSNFKSLTRGFVNANIPKVLKYFDTLQGEDRKVLVSDFTQSRTGTSSAIAAIEASGCFVENAEFEISGIKTVLPNNRNPADIYGTNFNPRTSVIQTKVAKTIREQSQNRVRIGMLQIRDEEHLNDFVREHRVPPN